MTQPSYWKAFAESGGLAGKNAVIPKDKDLSEVGADIYWFDDEGSRSEKEDFYPGIAVAKDGFIPEEIAIAAAATHISFARPMGSVALSIASIMILCAKMATIETRLSQSCFKIIAAY